jgi:hypothetical protein
MTQTKGQSAEPPREPVSRERRSNAGGRDGCGHNLSRPNYAVRRPGARPNAVADVQRDRTRWVLLH